MRTYGTATLLKDLRCWAIEAEPHVIIRLKRVFQKVNKAEHGVVHLSDTLENCRELLWFLERYPMAVVDLPYLKARSRAHAEQSERLVSVIDGRYEPRDFPLALPLRQYQKVAAETALQAGGLLLADDLGIGKTAAAIGVIADSLARPALVVTMTSLTEQWQGELRKFAPGLRTHILKSGQPYDIVAAMNGRRGVRGPTLPGFNEWPDVIVTNYHKLSGWADLLAGKIRGVVFDECQELRHAGSAKYAAAEHIAERAEVRVGLSATPIHNYGSEIFTVMRVLKPLALGTYQEFAREWCVGGNGSEGRDKIHDPKAFGVYMREQALMLRRTRSEVGRELPPLITVPHHIDADTAPLEAVHSAATELARVILAQGGLARGEKLKASEELSWRLRQATGIAKAPHVADFVRMLAEQGEKVLLGGWHREVYSIWAERLKDLGIVFFTGTESATEKRRSFDAFVNGDARVLAISLRAGAGLDGLQGACRTVVHGELDWSPAVHDQLNGRPHRDGQTEAVAAYYLTTDTGSDPVVADVLGLKRQQIDGIRDPSAPLLEKLQGGEQNIRRLAEAYLRQRGLDLPATGHQALTATGTGG